LPVQRAIDSDCRGGERGRIADSEPTQVLLASVFGEPKQAGLGTCPRELSLLGVVTKSVTATDASSRKKRHPELTARGDLVRGRMRLGRQRSR